MRALIARRCRSRGDSFRSAPPSELLSRALPVIRQRLFFFTRHLAELPSVGLRCILAGATLKRDDQSHPENIVTRDTETLAFLEFPQSTAQTTRWTRTSPAFDSLARRQSWTSPRRRPDGESRCPKAGAARRPAPGGHAPSRACRRGRP